MVVVVAEAGSFFLRCFLMDAFPARSKALVVVTQAERRIREMRRRTVLIADELIRIRGNDEIEILLVPECRPRERSTLDTQAFILKENLKFSVIERRGDGK